MSDRMGRGKRKIELCITYNMKGYKRTNCEIFLNLFKPIKSYTWKEISNNKNVLVSREMMVFLDN